MTVASPIQLLRPYLCPVRRSQCRAPGRFSFVQGEARRGSQDGESAPSSDLSVVCAAAQLHFIAT